MTPSQLDSLLKTFFANPAKIREWDLYQTISSISPVRNHAKVVYGNKHFYMYEDRIDGGEDFENGMDVVVVETRDADLLHLASFASFGIECKIIEADWENAMKRVSAFL